jgi:hypothetical protein
MDLLKLFYVGQASTMHSTWAYHTLMRISRDSPRFTKLAEEQGISWSRSLSGKDGDLEIAKEDYRLGMRHKPCVDKPRTDTANAKDKTLLEPDA